VQSVERGDLVRVAQRFSGNWGSERVPVFNDGSAALGVVMELATWGPDDALVLIDVHPTWVVVKNLEVVNAS
jgi:hypothetical protein